MTILVHNGKPVYLTNIETSLSALKQADPITTEIVDAFFGVNQSRVGDYRSEGLSIKIAEKYGNASLSYEPSPTIDRILEGFAPDDFRFCSVGAFLRRSKVTAFYQGNEILGFSFQ